MSHFTPAKDARVEKLRRLLREGSVITKYDFLDFVSVYKHFHEAGFKVRPTLTKWIQENHKTVLEWLPDILKVRPGFFADLQPNSKYNTFKEYQTLAALGLSGQGSSEPPLDHQPVSRRSPDLGTASTPANVTLRELSDFGTPIPDSAIIKRPSLSGQTQQKVWLDDIKEVHHHLREIKSWLVKSSQALGPRDPMTPSLTEAAQRIPDFSDRVDTAQLCFDDIKSQYDQEVAELMRGRARMPRYSPAPMEVEGEVAERERTATAVPDAKAHVQSPSPTILVVSDIVREGQASSAGARSETAAEAGTARNLGTARQMNGPRDDGVPATPHREIPRRSAMVSSTSFRFSLKAAVEVRWVLANLHTLPSRLIPTEDKHPPSSGNSPGPPLPPTRPLSAQTVQTATMTVCRTSNSL